MSLKDKIIGLIGLLVFVALLYVSSQSAIKKEISVENHKYETIGKVFRIDIRRSFTDACYYYNYNGSRYESFQSIKESGDNYINRFYKINLSTENPSYSKIFLDQEVTDSTEIIKAELHSVNPRAGASRK